MNFNHKYFFLKKQKLFAKVIKIKIQKNCQFLDDLESRVPVLFSPQNHIDSLDILVPAGNSIIIILVLYVFILFK